MDRKNQVDLQMQLLIIQVQTGKLTVEQYTHQLQDKKKEEIERAKRFKIMGKTHEEVPCF